MNGDQEDPRNFASMSEEAEEDSLNEIERDVAFDEWYDSCKPAYTAIKELCRNAWNAGHEAAEKGERK